MTARFFGCIGGVDWSSDSLGVLKAISGKLPASLSTFTDMNNFTGLFSAAERDAPACVVIIFSASPARPINMAYRCVNNAHAAILQTFCELFSVCITTSIARSPFYNGS